MTVRFCDNWLRILAALSDIEYQRRVWFGSEGTEVSTFDEETGTLIERYRILLKQSKLPENQQLYPEKFLDLLGQLYEKVYAYICDSESIQNSVDEEKLFSDQRWLQIVSMAQKTCDVLKRRIQEVDNDER